MRLEEENQFELAKKLHYLQNPLALEKICLNFLEKTWSFWVSACNIQQKNLFNNICKFIKFVLQFIKGHRIQFRRNKNL